MGTIYNPLYSFLLFIIYLLFLFLAVLGLRFCVRAFSSCGEWGPLFIAAHGAFTIAASLVAEHRLQTLRLCGCGSRAQLLRSMWDLPRPGLEPVPPALAGRFSTTAPPGQPLQLPFKNTTSGTTLVVQWVRLHAPQLPFKNTTSGTTLVVQWVRLHAPNAGDLGLIPGRGTRSHMHAATKHVATKILCATTKTWCSQNK